MLGTFFSHEYLCLKLILSLSSYTLPFFLWMFMGLSPLSPSSLGIDLTLNKMWVAILLITLSCLSNLNQLLCILFLCKYHFMQEDILFFLSDMFLHCQIQHVKWNSRDFLLEFFLFCEDIVGGSSMMSEWVASEKNVKSSQNSSHKHQSRQVWHPDKWRNT